MYGKKANRAYFGIAVTGYLSLIFLPDFPYLAALFLLVLLIPAWVSSVKRYIFRAYTRAWTVALTIFFAGSLVLIMFDGTKAHVVLACNLSMLQIREAYILHPSRSLWPAWFWAFFMISLSAFLGGSSFLPIIMIVFLFCSIYGLFWNCCRSFMLSPLRHTPGMRIEIGPYPEYTWRERSVWMIPDDISPTSLKKIRGSLALTCAATVFLTFFLYSIIPRAQMNFNSGRSTDGYHGNRVFTGFSTMINLGDMSEIIPDQTPVMKVRFPGIRFDENKLYLRGSSFDIFTGAGWNKSPRLRVHSIHKVDHETGRTQLRDIPPGAVVVEQETIMLENMQQRLFPTGYPVSISGLSGRMGDSVYMEDSGSLFLKLPTPLERYNLQTARFASTGSFLAEPVNEQDEFDHIAFLQKHPDLNWMEITRLADSIAGRAGTPREKALLIEFWLGREGRYSLKPPQRGKAFSIENFLFDDMTGHCALFATGMILLLRSLDVPCRFVVGFHGGEYDHIDRSFLISRANAHAWVEVLDPERGWLRFDPTPSAPMPVYSERLMFMKIRDIARSMLATWKSFILGYDGRAQKKVVGKIGSMLQKATWWTSGSTTTGRIARRCARNMKQPLFWIVAGILVIANLIIFSALRRIRPVTGKQRTGKGKPRGFLRMNGHIFERLAASLKGNPAMRRPETTPMEFLVYLGRKSGAPPVLVREACERYYALRYGPEEGRESERRILEKIIRVLFQWRKKMMKKTGRGATVR